MEKEVEFLNYIFKNAKMGIIGIEDILNEVENESFEELLNEQYEEYESICNKAKEVLKCYGKQTEDIGKLSKLSSSIMVKMETLTDKSTSNIAKMMMEGTNKGIIEIKEKINNIKIKDEEIIDLAKELLETEEKNYEDLKEFL